MHRLTVAFVAGLVVAPVANAQRVVGSYTVAHSDHQLIGTLNGYQLQAMTSRRGSLSGTFSVGRYTGSHMRSGIACGGLIPPPPACPVEPLRDETTTSDFGATLGVTLFQRVFGAPIEGTGTVGAQVLHVRSHSLGETTGNDIEADRTKLGPTLGLELTARPKAAVPIGLRLGVVGGFFGDTESGILDGYTPFESGFSFTRFEAGLVLFLHR
jgi:hypothetical protein